MTSHRDVHLVGLKLCAQEKGYVVRVTARQSVTMDGTRWGGWGAQVRDLFHYPPIAQ
jgi:hypothetical protein